jgi:hypothetical protein
VTRTRAEGADDQQARPRAQNLPPVNEYTAYTAANRTTRSHIARIITEPHLAIFVDDGGGRVRSGLRR